MFTNKELRNAKRAIDKTAFLSGETKKQFRLELLKAMHAAENNPDPLVKAEWADFEYTGDQPTPEEFVAWCRRKVIEMKKD